ncbi:MAG: DNA polymerase I [Bacteroidetes bacterium GWF2_41_61]|nr:MAG: DNA polymerase I [Bacteroidetes bacterium GWF2_41_61]HBG23547.1 DNA polymerase I [Rikenellaceae bacterium]
MEMKKLLLIDGHALIFRSYYAFLRRPMINSKGVDTSILFGFTKTLIELLIKERPTHFAVAFDPPAKTFRHELYPEYKANRSETPELIKSALEPLIEIMEAISVPVIMKSGFEADDVIGTIATKAAKEGFTVYMVTPDKDFGQLVNDNVYQYKPGKNGLENELLGRDEICEVYGIENPLQIIDILTIWGDASDNIPGVRGIGEVGSKKLIGRYKSVDGIYKSLDQLPQKQREAFEQALEYIDLSRRLVTIDVNVDVEWNEESLKLETPNFTKIKALFSQYEFTSLTRTLPQLEQLFLLSSEGKINASGNLITQSESENTTFIKTKVVPVDELKSIVISNGYLSVKISSPELILCCEDVASIVNINSTELTNFKEIFEQSSMIICGYELKTLINILEPIGIRIKGHLADIELMHYLLSPERSHKIDILAGTYLGVELNRAAQEVPKDLFSNTADDQQMVREIQLREVSLLFPIYKILQQELEKEEITSLYNDIEMPLITVLADMEYEGIKIDTAMLEEYSRQLTLELAGIESNIRDMANEPTLNVSSPKQLGVLLYEKLKIVKSAKRTSKKNYSTDEETLAELIDAHPVVSQILEYRNIKKLLSTYIDPLPSIISPISGKIHTTYNQSLTSTGRLSSVRPNLQNIPIRTERGREIRKAFVPSHKGGVIMSADYSQIELRLMAHMSGDELFITAFREGRDIHAATASKIFGVAEDQLTKEQRNRAKVANFGIIYGISAFGLSQRLAIPRAESKKLIEDYFANYPQVERYMNQMIEKARVDGYVTTLYGRKRYLPDINSKNPVVRGLAERNAINAPIQGSAADIIKVAMVRIAKRITDSGLKSRMVLQVHDELVFDAYASEIEELKNLVKEEMEGVIKLDVPLTIECQFGLNWLEAH